MKLPPATTTEYGYVFQYDGDEYELHKIEVEGKAAKWQLKVLGENLATPFGQIKKAKQFVVDNAGESEYDDDDAGVRQSTGVMTLDCVHPAALLAKRIIEGDIDPTPLELETIRCYSYMGIDDVEINENDVQQELNRFSETPKGKTFMEEFKNKTEGRSGAFLNRVESSGDI